MPIKIFISHASVDEPLASALVDCIFSSMILNDNEVRCTSVPGHKLQIGSDFAHTLREELDESSVVVGLITQSAIQSSWVLFELGATWGAEKKLKPLVSSEVNVGALPGPLSGRHVARLSDRGDMVQFLDELTTLIAAKPRSPSKREHAIDVLLAAHAEHVKTSLERDASNALQVQKSLVTEHFGLSREELRLCITLGWQLGRYEFAYGSKFPEAQAVAPSIAAEIKRLLDHDGFPENVSELSLHDLMESITSHYSTTSSGKYAAIMMGVAAMRASLVGASKDEESNREMERVAYSALADVDPILLPDKINLFNTLVERRPRGVVEVIQIIDNHSTIRR